MPIEKIKPKYIYLFFFFLMAIVFYLSYQRYEMHVNTMKTGEKLRVRIEKVVCSGNKENQNYFVFRSEQENRIVNVGKQACINLQIGDSTDVLYNKDYDLYFPTVINTSKDKWGMAGGIVFMLISLFYLLFHKKTNRLD